MNREFLVNIIFLVLINLLIKPFYIFGIDRTIQNTVADGEYGIYFTLFSFTYLFQILNDFGIQNFNNRNISQSRQLIDKYFPNIMVLKILMAIVFMAVVFLSAEVLGFEKIRYQLLFLVAFNWVLTSFVFYLRSNISGLGMYRVDSMFSVLDKLLLIIICSILLWTPIVGGVFKIEWFALAQTFSLGIVALVAFVIVYKKLKRFRFRFQPVFWLLIFKQSYPFAFILFLMTAYTRLDGVMIERMLPEGRFEADIYASAYRLLDASNMFAYLFAGLLLPMFSRLFKEKKEVASLVRTSFNLIWAASVALVLAVWFFREEIMRLLYDNGNAYSGEILGYLIISFIGIAGGYIYGTLLTAGGKLKGMNIIFVFGLLLNFSLNYYLIPHQHALGAAKATAITQLFVFVLQLLYAYRTFQLHFSWSLALKLLTFTITSILFTFLVQNYLPFEWFLRFLISGVGSIGLAFLFRVLDIRDMLALPVFDNYKR